MSDSYTDVRSGLRTVLLTVANLPSVAWEGRPFTPRVGDAYLIEQLVPLGAPVTSLGNAGWLREEFMYELILYTPLEDRLFDHEDMVGDIRQAFYPGLPVGAGVNAYAGFITQTDRGGIVSEPDWKSTPIMIEGYFHRNRKVA